MRRKDSLFEGSAFVITAMIPDRKTLGFFIVCLIANANIGFGDQPAPQLLNQWISPNGTYIAKMELVQAPGFVRLIVGPTKDDKTIISLTEQFDIPVSSPLSQAFKALWSPKEDQFCLFSWDPANITGRLVTVQTPSPSFPGDKEKPQFVVSKTYSPIYAMQPRIDEVRKLMTNLTPASGSMQVGGSEIISGGWVGEDQMDVVMEMGGSTFDLKDGKAVNVVDYKATWKTTFQLSLEGFKIVSTDPVNVTKTDRQTKQTTSVKLGDK
jgi:hypothetical protein